MRHYNHPFFGPSILTGDPHEITLFLASQRVPISDLYGLVHAPPSQVGQCL